MRKAGLVLDLVVATDPVWTPLVVFGEDEMSKRSCVRRGVMAIERVHDVIDVVGATVTSARHESIKNALRICLMIFVLDFCLTRPSESGDSDETFSLPFGQPTSADGIETPESVEREVLEMVRVHSLWAWVVRTFVELLEFGQIRGTLRRSK